MIPHPTRRAEKIRRKGCHISSSSTSEQQKSPNAAKHEQVNAKIQWDLSEEWNQQISAEACTRTMLSSQGSFELIKKIIDPTVVLQSKNISTSKKITGPSQQYGS